MTHGRQANRHRTVLAASGAAVALPVMAGFPADLAPAAFPLVAPAAGQATAAADEAAIALHPRMLRIARLAAPLASAAGPLMPDYASDIHGRRDWGKAAVPVAVQRPRPRAARLPIACL